MNIHSDFIYIYHILPKGICDSLCTYIFKYIRPLTKTVMVTNLNEIIKNKNI